MDPTSRDGDNSVLNVDELFERCLGHLDFLQRVLTKFQQSFAEGIDLLEQGVATHDAQAIVQVAHRLKGAAANVAAAGLRGRAAEIEQLGRNGGLAEIPEQVAGFRGDWRRFVEEVASRNLCRGVG